MRGKGWGKPHSTVNYVFKHDMSKLYDYHIKVMEEMLDRGYNVSEEWLDFNYRGKILGYDNSISYTKTKSDKIYSEHDSKYLDDCLDNLMLKGIII